MSPITLRLPFPESTNHLYATVHGRRILSAQGKAYKEEVGWLVRSAWGGQPALRGSVALAFEVHCPDRRRRDLDNLLKIMQDGLQEGGAFLNDAQVDDLHIMRGAPEKPGYVVATITKRVPCAS